ncbi:aquaporin Z [Clostridia bacterium]|nr:aquaporin Z [Clostridia bacterium]
MENFKKYLAEFIGTGVLVFMGCGSAIFSGVSEFGPQLTVAFAFGLSIIAMAYVIGNISGCHINPAVSLAMLLQKRIGGKDFVGYVIAQVLGSIAAAAGLRLMLLLTGLKDRTGGAIGANSIANTGLKGALLIEIILTFIFVFTILGVTADESKGSVAGLVIGLTLTFVHIVGIPLTGTSVNPARSIGPAIFSHVDSLGSLWVFIAAPLVGAVIASLVYSLLYKKK